MGITRERIEAGLLAIACLVLTLHVARLMGCVFEARGGFIQPPIQTEKS